MVKDPINEYNNYLRARFGERVQKITVHGGFTCPNRDGSEGQGGCTYCNNRSFAAPEKIHSLSITDQINHGITKSKHRYKNVNKYLIYFQSYSNTYAPLERLQALYQEALAHPQVVGLSIGTRPDCVNPPILDYIATLNQTHHITIEYGIESIFDDTLNKLNRCTDHQTARQAIIETAKRGIDVCAHLIFGLPGETDQRVIDTAREISSLPIHSLKLHQLHIVKETQLAKDYVTTPFPLLTQDQYTERLRIFIEHLRPTIFIQRLLGEAPPEMLIDPPWPLKLPEFTVFFKKILLTSSSFQGIRYRAP